MGATQTDYMTLQEVAAYLKSTGKTVYRFANEEIFPGFKVGGSWRFKRSEIEKWIDKRPRLLAAGVIVGRYEA